MNLRDFFKKNPTLADLCTALAALDDELAAATQRKEHLGAETDGVYLEGTDAAIEKHHAALTAVGRDVERLTIQRAALARRVADAERNEEIAELKRQVHEGEAALKEAVDLLTRTYPKQAAAVVATLLRLDELYAAKDRANAAIEHLVRLGVAEPRTEIPEPHNRAYAPLPGMEQAVVSRSPLQGSVVLPDPRNGGPFWDGRPHFWPLPEENTHTAQMKEVARLHGGIIPWSKQLIHQPAAAPVPASVQQ